MELKKAPLAVPLHARVPCRRRGARASPKLLPAKVAVVQGDPTFMLHLLHTRDKSPGASARNARVSHVAFRSPSSAVVWLLFCSSWGHTLAAAHKVELTPFFCTGPLPGVLPQRALPAVPVQAVAAAAHHVLPGRVVVRRRRYQHAHVRGGAAGHHLGWRVSDRATTGGRPLASASTTPPRPWCARCSIIGLPALVPALPHLPADLCRSAAIPTALCCPYDVPASGCKSVKTLVDKQWRWHYVQWLLPRRC